MTAVYRDWINSLKDRTGRARIQVRVIYLFTETPGNTSAAYRRRLRAEDHFGPGYRVYYTEREGDIVILLAGGDKSTQRQDIKAAISLSRNL